MTWFGDELGRIADDMPERDLGARAIEIHQRRRRNLMAVSAAAVVVVTVLAATVGGKVLSAEPQDAVAPPGPPEQTILKIGVVPTVEAAPLYLAQARGYFRQEGLTVRPTIVTSSAMAMPEVRKGRLDIAQTDYLVAFAAHNRGLDIKVVGSLYQAGRGSFALMVKAKSAIRTVGDLKGKKVGISQLNGLGTLSMAAMLKRSGLRTDDVKLIEMSLPRMNDSLADGYLDAILTAEPYITTGVREGRTRVLTDAMDGPFAKLHTAGWMATGDWSRRNPRTLAAFQRALAKAHRLIASDPAQVREILPSYLKVDKPIAADVALGSYPAQLNLRELQRVADLAREHDHLKDWLDVRSVVSAG
ncbi:ABC transporter substrate-binding protein [Nonomuraea sp. NPDC002799]